MRIQIPYGIGQFSEGMAAIVKYRQLCHELCNKSSAVAAMGDRLATMDMGLLCPLFREGELGPI